MITASDLPDTDIPVNTKAPGIYMGTMVVRTAFIEAINDLRRNPWLLKYVFASFAQDELTAKKYGLPQIDRAIEWFKTTEINVIMAISPNDVQFPVISITELGCQEEGATLGDVNYDTKEDLDLLWSTIVGPINATAYDPDLGKISFNSADFGDSIVVDGMVLLLRDGTVLEILNVDDGDVFVKPTSVPLDLVQVLVRSQRPTQQITLESIRMRENYGIVLEVQGEPVFLLYLQAIIRFCYFRYKQTLFEKRGFENSKLSWTDTTKDDYFRSQLTYRTQFQLSGVVHWFWPKDVATRIDDVGVQTRVIGMSTGLTDISNEPWVGDEDVESFEDFGKNDPDLLIARQGG